MLNNIPTPIFPSRREVVLRAAHMNFLSSLKIKSMSVVVVKIKNEENTSLLKKFISILHEKAKVLSDEDYRDSLFSKLLEEGRKSKTLSAAETKKELKKRGINI